MSNTTDDLANPLGSDREAAGETRVLPAVNPLGSDREDAHDAYETRALPDSTRTESVDALRQRLADAESVAAAQIARDDAWRAERAAERSQAEEQLEHRVSEMESLVLVVATEDDAPSFTARLGARGFLHGGQSAIGNADPQLHSLATLHFEVVRLLVGAAGSPIGDRLDALERNVWTALHARATYVADPSQSN